MPILSFVHVYRRAVDGQDEGWRNLIKMFLPLTDHMVRQSFADVWPVGVKGPAEFFGQLRAENAARLQAYTGLSEKAFLVYLRDELFALGRAKRGENAPLGMTHEQFAELLNEFAPIPRQAVMMLAKGYAPEKFAIVLHMEDESAKQVLAKANEKLEARGLSARLPAPMRSGFDRLLQNLEQQEATPECLPVLTFVRIVDGQITWDDKEAADKHMAECAHCFQHFVSYLELHWSFRDLIQAGDERVEEVARAMGLAPVTTEKKGSLMGRIFKTSKGKKSASA